MKWQRCPEKRPLVSNRVDVDCPAAAVAAVVAVVAVVAVAVSAGWLMTADWPCGWGGCGGFQPPERRK